MLDIFVVDQNHEKRLE